MESLLRLLLCAALVLSGCAGIGRVLGFGAQMERMHELGRIEGQVGGEGEARGPLVVLLARVVEGGDDELVGEDTFLRVRPGRYLFAVAPGRFRVGVYEDANRNGLLDPGERTRSNRDGPILSVGPGQSVRHDVLLAADATSPPSVTAPLNVFDLVVRSPDEQHRFALWSLSVEGAIRPDLDAEDFGPAAGTRGLWEIMDFLSEGLAGIYFLEAYDPDRIPVLFVHGIDGYPRQLAPLMQGIDRSRFQPWFYFYPSGFSLDALSGHLAMLLERVQVRHGFDELAIVAHSMGGLVARGAILKYARETGRDDVRLFVSASTPWGGDVHAEQAGSAPVELPPAFADLRPSSDYLHWLFYEDEARAVPRRLPSGVEYHMMVGYHMPGTSERANDGSVSVASQAFLEAQEQAATIRAYDRGHVEILDSPEALARVNRLLAARFP